MREGLLIRKEDALRINLTFQIPEIHARASRKIKEAAECGARAAVAAYAEYIKALPEVDAVEVVRCKDCKYKEIVFGKDVCGCEGYSVPLDYFCATGERRFENEDLA